MSNKYEGPWAHLPDVSWEYLAKVRAVMDKLNAPPKKKRKGKKAGP